MFERLLSEREAPGLQISSPRALFDLWVDAAEQAYAEMALSKEYRGAYGNLVNAQMKLRAGIQKEVELASSLLGMPTRSELDGAHRKIVELERALRRLRDAAEGGTPPARTEGEDRGPRKPAAKKPARRSAAKPAAAKTTATKSAAPAKTKKASAPAAARDKANAAPTARRPARKVASTPFVRAAKAPTNGFSMAIPVAPLPLVHGDDA